MSSDSINVCCMFLAMLDAFSLENKNNDVSIYNFKVITEEQQQPCPFFCEFYFLTILFANKYLVWKYTLAFFIVQRVGFNACNQ